MRGQRVRPAAEGCACAAPDRTSANRRTVIEAASQAVERAGTASPARISTGAACSRQRARFR